MLITSKCMKNIKTILHKLGIQNLLVCAFLLIVLLIPALLQGYEMSKYQNFVSTNGDFQNYNPVRRLLDGQTPYLDFTVYLGAGHLFTMGIMVMLLGNTLKSSMFAAAFLSVLFSALLIFLCNYLILQNKKVSLYFTVFIYYLFYGISIGVYPATSLKNLLNYISPFYSAGNSARPIRWAALPVFISLLLIGIKCITRKINKRTNDDLKQKINYRPYLTLFAILIGLFVPWSNDMGISMYLCSSFVYFIFLIRIWLRNNNDKKNFGCLYVIRWILLYILISTATLIISSSIITYGHPIAWLRSCLEISSYQSWYYSSSKCCYWYQLIFDFFVFADIFLLVYLYFKIIKTEKNRHALFYGMQAIIISSAILIHFIYDFSTGEALLELARFVLIIFALGYFYKAMYYSFQKHLLIIKYAKVTCILLCITTISIISYNKLSVLSFNGIYFKELGGYNTNVADSLVKEKSLLTGKKVFSTYASSAEVLTNQFQPTGTDYLIHVLGDNTRKKYMDVFRKGDFDYVGTINGGSNVWEYWACNVNWFFYRELFDKYSPIISDVSGRIHAFWKKSESSNSIKIDTKLDISMEKTYSKLDGNNKSLLTVITPDNFSGIADVTLNYDVDIASDFYRTGGINYFIKIENLTSSYSEYPKNFYFIPIDENIYYIPIPIDNGMGQVRISIYPEKAASFSAFSATVNAIYPNFEDLISSDKLDYFYANLKENQYLAANVDDVNWTNGINENIILMKEEFTDYDQFAGKTIVASDGTTNKIQYAIWENNFTCLVCEKPVSNSFAYNNVFTIIK